MMKRLAAGFNGIVFNDLVFFCTTFCLEWDRDITTVLYPEQ